MPVDKDAIFSAYITALAEDPKQYRQDASKLEQWASSISDPADLHPAADASDDVRKELASIAERVKEDKFLYSRFFAVGLFRLLELSKAKDPSALQGLVKAMNVSQDAVNRDLMNYKVCCPILQHFCSNISIEVLCVRCIRAPLEITAAASGLAGEVVLQTF